MARKRAGAPQASSAHGAGRAGVAAGAASGARSGAAASRGPSEVRIVGGVWKRSKLPVADRPGLRPTPDRVRETLFNWLGQDLNGWRVLDAFAGSGALGFEAASRGASHVTLLEKDASLATQLRANLKRLDKDGTVPMRIEVADALAWMGRAASASFDLVLLDPPFAQDLFQRALRAAAPLLVPQGLIYLEAPEALEPPPELGLSLWREGRAGAVHYRLFQRNG
ncbi:16S rRNA (guanine(966)-N(2))-methyltransferase RsmD [Roseateles terrae]|uniref:16S rRNA (Guanine(966)-N(2))-methyltransferase RsmD n=1 Tax=Roseateles terrae TaxID=431060 RepID=A0ABR6GVP2_9BURK|nr:16S rRNA (guanine(966)-N(2))-methyltransferase RsmD [Roseateles terrae]